MSRPLPKALRVMFGLSLLAIVAWFVVDFPILRLPLAIGFASYAICLWCWPQIWLVALPALLPVFDLAPWSGRFFFDEFDASVLLTAGLLALRDPADETLAPMSRNLRLVLALLVASYFVSTFIRLWPLPPITPDSFANYYSPYNSLRVAKGFIWALLLLRPLRQSLAKNANTKELLCLGLLLGLFGVAIVGLYERWLFTGVLTWVTNYRITSTFSSMHTGDGHIDVWLATTIPLLGIFLISRRWLLLLPVTFGLGLLSLYTLIATGSRAPLLAIAIALGVGVLALLATRAHTKRVVGTIALSSTALVLIATMGLPFLSQTSLWQRFAQTGQDAEIRMDHVRLALALRDDSVFAHLFGMGLGSFPQLHQERATGERRSARYRFNWDGTAHFLTLWPGLNLYMGQVVAAAANTDYQLSARLHTAEPGASLTVAWCEMWMLASSNCTWNILQPRTMPDNWQILRQTIHVEQTGTGRSSLGALGRRPTRLTFFVSGEPSSGVDIGEISLKDPQGRELLRNGDFVRGGDFWFWAVDDHLQWHTKNLFINVLFDQGWLGVLAVGALLMLTLATLVYQVANGKPLAAVLLASITGFTVMGVVASTFDQPRLALMFYILNFAILADPKGLLQRNRALLK